MTPPATIGKYQIIKPLGSGKFGDVYHVLDRALHSEKAIKVLRVTNPNEFKESLDEAKILNHCVHKHIVRISEANVFKIAGALRVVLDLEYIPGGSLESALESRWVSIHDVVRYIQGALHGLEHAHAQGFLHRDIKPGNIMLAAPGSKLSDFGLATSGGTGLTGSGQGYVTHLPPECWQNDQTTALTDVFAAGMTLYRAASNLKGWRSIVGSIPNARKLIREGKLIHKIGFMDYISKALKKIIRKSCNADPAKRYASAAEFRQQLDKLRFGIDWVATSSLSWEGRNATGVYSMTTDPSTFEVTYKKNGRRQNAKCERRSSLHDATTFMAQHVADSTLC